MLQAGLFDIIDAPTAPTARVSPLVDSSAQVRRDALVTLRDGDGQVGQVMLDPVLATGRVPVRWPDAALWTFHHVEELRVVEAAAAPAAAATPLHEHVWTKGERQWPGETDHRLTWECACGEWRGRVV